MRPTFPSPLTLDAVAKRDGLIVWKVRQIFERGLRVESARVYAYRVLAVDKVPAPCAVGLSSGWSATRCKYYFGPRPLKPRCSMHIPDRIKALRRVLAGDLKPHPKNWRRHPESQRNALLGLLAEIGYADVLLTRELPDGSLQIIDGHLRAETTPDCLVPVLVTDLTEDEAEKVLLTHDPLASMATADKENLESLLASLKFESPDVSAMLEGLATEFKIDPQALIFQGQTDPDAIPEPPDNPTTHPGDLWLLGQHCLLCGDSSKAEEVDRLLDGAVIHLVNTDPPYNVKVEPRSNNAIAAGLSSFQGTRHHQGLDLARHPDKAKPTQKKLRAKDRPLANDFLSDEDFDRLLDAWFGNIARVLLPGHSFFIWAGYANLGNYPPFLKKHDLYFSEGIVWDKQWPVLTRKDFMGAFELAFYGWKLGAAHRFFGPNNATDLWSVKKVNPLDMQHLTEKPVALAVRAMQYSSQPGENVLDLFGGSGSTLIAAEQTGRRAFLMEIDPLYCDVIVCRWEQFTGKKAERWSD
jgi:DNA modification methylase